MSEQGRPGQAALADSWLPARAVPWTDGAVRGALVLLPGAALAFFSFNAGGFFPNTPAFVAIVLIEILVLWVALGNRALPPAAVSLKIAAAALFVFAGWTLASAMWSDAPARALVEFDRALLYLLALVLMGSAIQLPSQMRWLVRALTAAIFVVCMVALVSRLLPEVLSTSAAVPERRLSYPLTYANALGILAAVGVVLSLHLCSSLAEPRTIRVIAATGPPVCASTLFFTFSRGAMVAGIVALLVYLAIGRSRGLVTGLVATVPATVVAIFAAYGANRLATIDPSAAVALDQGRHVAIVLMACILFSLGARMLLVLADGRLARIHVSQRFRKGLVASLAAVAVLGGGTFLAAADVPSYAAKQYELFLAGGSPAPGSGDLRQRLTDPSSSKRPEYWTVALDGLGTDHWKGTGAGTYEPMWATHRDVNAGRVTDAHGLYFEVAGELGIVGLAALIVAISAILLGLARRVRGDERPLYGALLAAGIAWVLHAGVDWDWEMPATTMWFFAVGGAALAVGPRSAPIEGRPNFRYRIAVVITLLAAGVAPLLVLLSQSDLDKSGDAFNRGDCKTASKKATESLQTLRVRPEPYEILAYCALRDGFPGLAATAMQSAARRDPSYWGYRYGLAVAQAADGRDPRPAARLAQELNPGEPIVREAARRFETPDKRRWKRGSIVARRAIVREGLLEFE